MIAQEMIYTFDPYEDYPWKEALKEMYADGVRNFSFLYPLVLAWQEDGSFDFHVLDELTDEILSLTGDVRLHACSNSTEPPRNSGNTRIKCIMPCAIRRSPRRSGGMMPPARWRHARHIFWNVTDCRRFWAFSLPTAPAESGDSSAVIPTGSSPTPIFPGRWSRHTGTISWNATATVRNSIPSCRPRKRNIGGRCELPKASHHR